MNAVPALATPHLSQAKRILAIQPHYDDNDIGAGGTLFSLAQAGAELIYLTVTDDMKGVISPTWSEEEARRHLQSDREKAAAIMGVTEQVLLDFPDAGDYNYFDLRAGIIREIRTIKPDFIFTVDPWSPYEAHHDHVLTGKAVAEAAILYGMPAVGDALQPDLADYVLQGVVFYNTVYPNLVYDISPVLEEKNAILHCYQAQFTPEGLEELVTQVSFLASYVARDESFTYGEALKVVAPWMLHGMPLTMNY